MAGLSETALPKSLCKGAELVAALFRWAPQAPGQPLPREALMWPGGIRPLLKKCLGPENTPRVNEVRVCEESHNLFLEM